MSKVTICLQKDIFQMLIPAYLKIRSLLLFCSMLFASALQAQLQSDDYLSSCKLYSIENGLASREVYCGLQDDDGFLWYGTRNGLNRFDGKEFKLYTRQRHGLKENKVIQLAKDNKNHLFILYGHQGFKRNYKSMQVMDLKTNKLTSLKECYPKLPFAEERVYWVANDGDDLCFLVSNPCQYWRLSKKGFELKYEMKGWDIFLFERGGYASSTGPLCIFKDGHACLIYVGDKPIYFLTPTGNHTIVADKGKYYGCGSISPNNEAILTKESYEDIFLGFDKAYSNGKVEKDIKLPLPYSANIENWVFTPSYNTREMVAYSPLRGLFLYDHKGAYKLMAPEALGNSGLFNAHCFFTDKQGNRWICTSTGIVRVKLDKNRFQHYFTKKQIDAKLTSQARGIFVDFQDGKEVVYANVWDRLFSTNGINTLVDGYGYSLTKHQNRLFFGAFTLFEYDEKARRISQELVPENKKELWSLYPLSKDELLYGTPDTIVKYNINTRKVTYPFQETSQFPKLSFAYRIFKGKDNNIWVACSNGLYTLDEKAERITRYYGSNVKDSTYFLPYDNIHDVFEEKEGVFWIATNGEGLFKWERAANKFTQFTLAEGLPSNTLYRIESDGLGNIWVSSDNGLFRLDLKSFLVKTYTVKDGLTHNEFNRISSFKAQDGRLFFGGLDGVNAFHPKDFLQDSFSNDFPVRITAFAQFSSKLNKLEERTTDLILKNKIVLEPGDKFFTLEFALLDFEEGIHRFAYKIDGLDKDWNYISENSIRISGLPPGEFILRVKGQTQSGVWSKTELFIPVEVQIPFYEEWWFWSIIIAATLLIAGFLYRLRTYQHLQTQMALEETVNERTEQLRGALEEREVLLKEIHHRVKNNLEVMSSLLELQSQSIVDENAKSAILEGQSRVQSIALIHHNLYQQDDLSSLEFRTFVTDLFEQIRNVFNRPDDEISLEIIAAETMIDFDTAVPLGLILNELFTNTFKYGLNHDRHNLISVQLYKPNESPKDYELVYKDEGPGMPKGFDIKKSTSLGMRLIFLLSKQLRGSFDYTYEQGSVFRIPFQSIVKKR